MASKAHTTRHIVSINDLSDKEIDDDLRARAVVPRRIARPALSLSHRPQHQDRLGFHPGEPVLRAEHAHAALVRERDAAARRRDHHQRRPGHQLGGQGREPRGLGARDRQLRRHHGDPPSARRRGAARRRIFADPGDQRRRRQPRASDADAVRPVHAQEEEQAASRTSRSRSPATCAAAAPSIPSSMRSRASAPPSCRCRPRAWSCRRTSTAACARNSAARWFRTEGRRRGSSIDALYVTPDEPHQQSLFSGPELELDVRRDRDKKVDAVYVTRFQKERWADKDQAYPKIDRKFLKRAEIFRRQRAASAAARRRARCRVR